MMPETRHNNNSDEPEPLTIASLRLLAPPLRLVSAAMWKVMQQRDVMHYGKLEEFVTSVCKTVPGLLTYRHQAKLCVGLRARLILEHLRVPQSSDPDLVLPQLERLCAPALPGKRRRIEQKVEMAVKNFHTLVHTLLENMAKRERFFKEEFDSQYGHLYDSALEKLLWEFLTRLDQLLPVPDLAQTVSWITAAPAVLEECARSASQPQLLRTLLQHEKCLGHLDSAASLPSSTGDTILSSLSLPLSGKVRDSSQSGATPSPNMITIATPSTQKSNKRQKSGTVSHIMPVIGSIITADVSNEASSNQDVSAISEKDNEEVATVSNYTRIKSGLCQKGENLEKAPNKEHCVGNVLIKVINQTPTSSEDESQFQPVRRSSRKRSVNVTPGMSSSNKMLDLGRKRKRNGSSKTSRHKSQDTKPQEKEGLHSDLAFSMKHQLRVVIPKLELKDYTRTVLLKTVTEEENATLRSVHARNRKRKLSFSVTPEKNPSSNDYQQVYAGSPCIPTLMPLRMENSDSVPPLIESMDEVIFDSEDESTEKVKGRLFTRRYCKTKSNTYIPTLHEFWTPASFRRDFLSPGNSCR